MHEKKFRDGYAEETHAYHAIREKLRHKLRHPGCALDLISLVLSKPYSSLANHNPEFLCAICTVLHVLHWCITHFALVLHILHSFLSQSEFSNFFVYSK